MAKIVRILSVLVIFLLNGAFWSVAQEDNTGLVFSCPGASAAPTTYLFDAGTADWLIFVTAITSAVCDVDAFWRTVYGTAYIPPDYVVQVARTDTGNLLTANGEPACSSVPDGRFGGFYCPDSAHTGIALDRGATVSAFYGGSPASVLAIIAHEWGHHIQHTQLAVGEFSELQAECFSGAYAAFAVQSDAATVRITPSDWADHLAPYRNVSRPVLNHHEGWTGITYDDRAQAQQLGYDGGVTACLEAEFALPSDVLLPANTWLVHYLQRTALNDHDAPVPLAIESAPHQVDLRFDATDDKITLTVAGSQSEIDGLLGLPGNNITVTLTPVEPGIYQGGYVWLAENATELTITFRLEQISANHFAGLYLITQPQTSTLYTFTLVTPDAPDPG